jgi:cytochrome P450
MMPLSELMNSSEFKLIISIYRNRLKQQSVTQPDLKQTRDEVLTFLFAGHDTTASAISMAICCLIQNPSIMSQVQQEIVDQSINFDNIEQFKLLDRVWKETLRLYPPAMFLARKPVVDISLGGYFVPKNVSSYFKIIIITSLLLRLKS